MPYGYKNHVKADAESKLITGYTVTSANIHDSQVLAQLMDDEDYVLYADSAYYGETIFSALPKGLELKVHEKGSRNHPHNRGAKSKQPGEVTSSRKN